MPRIVVAFDGSPTAHRALDRAAELFDGADALVVSVAEGLGSLDETAAAARVALPDDVIRTAVARLHDERLEGARAIADKGAGAAPGALRAEPRAVAADSNVVTALLATSREVGADALVCGTRGHGAAARAVLGSVASGLVRHADLPVLVVPDEAVAAPGPLVVAFDGSPSATRAVEACGRLFAGREALVVYVWRSLVRHSLAGASLGRAPLPEIREVVADLDGFLGESAQQEADAGVTLAEGHGLRARALSVESADPPAQVIMASAAAHDAAAIAVGRRGRGPIAGAILGSVSASLVHAAHRPVLVTPA